MPAGSPDASPHDRPWFFGLLREGGGYRIIAAGPSEGRVRRALLEQSAPTVVATWDELPALGIGEAEARRWLPQELAQTAG
jgi:hypothetical protein